MTTARTIEFDALPSSLRNVFQPIGQGDAAAWARLAWGLFNEAAQTPGGRRGDPKTDALVLCQLYQDLCRVLLRCDVPVDWARIEHDLEVATRPVVAPQPGVFGTDAPDVATDATARAALLARRRVLLKSITMTTRSALDEVTQAFVQRALFLDDDGNATPGKTVLPLPLPFGPDWPPPFSAVVWIDECCPPPEALESAGRLLKTTTGAGSTSGADAPYRVLIDDNFHYQDEDARYELGRFATHAEAEAACRAIVDHFLEWHWQPGMSAEDLIEHYQDFGEDPFIQGPTTGPPFSAWTYARMRAKEMCDKPPAGHG